MDHIDAMDQFRRGITLRALGQRDPVVEYKMEGFDMFDEMVANIREDTVSMLFHIKVQSRVEQQEQKEIKTNAGEDGPPKPAQKEKTVGRNAPCPCGSGKKYKNCCGKS
jgi:preprotein translocase subunit SecA